MALSYPAPVQSPAVLALKALWRSNDRLSCCAPLAGKLAAIDAAKAGACPIGANYVAQGYSLPAGLTWPRVAELRAAGNHPAHMVPIVCAAGSILWGTPLLNGEYLLHPANVGAR